MDSPAALFKLLKTFTTPKNDPNDLNVIDLQVGRQVHRKVPGHMRTELWLSVLHRKGIGAAYAAQYRSMLAKVSANPLLHAAVCNAFFNPSAFPLPQTEQRSHCKWEVFRMSSRSVNDSCTPAVVQGVSAEVYSDIEKDVGRTFPGSPRQVSPSEPSHWWRLCLQAGCVSSNNHLVIV